MRTTGRLTSVIGIIALWGICWSATGCRSARAPHTYSPHNPSCASCKLPPGNGGYVQQTSHGGQHYQTMTPNGIVVEGPEQTQGAGPLPHELFPVSHPPYTVAPPDRLLIDAPRLIPRPPYRVDALETLLIDVKGTLPGKPISGQYTITPEGTLNLGYDYGSIRVQGLTLEEIQTALSRHLGSSLANPLVRVALPQFRGQQQVRGEHLVRPDGTVSLGMYGCVYVSGLTIGQIKTVIEKHLAHYFLNPQVSVDVLAYNSKYYYVIADGAGLGQQVRRFPITGNEHVLDAVANVQGLLPVSSLRRIWVARPSPLHMGCNQILPVDWQAVTRGASTATNYQLFPGDRVYIDADKLTRFNVWLNKILAPVERILGTTFLGVSTFNAFSNQGNGNNNGLIVVP